jgi:hypothetical protein
MHGVETPFHPDQIPHVGQVPNRMCIAGKCGDERTHKVVSEGRPKFNFMVFEVQRRVGMVTFDVYWTGSWHAVNSKVLI